MHLAQEGPQTVSTPAGGLRLSQQGASVIPVSLANRQSRNPAARRRSPQLSILALYFASATGSVAMSSVGAGFLSVAATRSARGGNAPDPAQALTRQSESSRIKTGRRDRGSFDSMDQFLFASCIVREIG